MITALSAGHDAAWQAHDGEARLLVELLRSSRLTLLFCDAETDKTAFLHAELMPLLRRRAGDQLAPAAAPRESGVVVPFPDRRQRAANASKRNREFVVHFDDWSGPPLPALRACIHRSAHSSAAERAAPPQPLGDTLEALSSRLDAQFIILFDRFEDFLRAPSDRAGHARFTDEWSEALQRPQLPANFLVAMNDDARPQLADLRQRIPGFDNFSLKLTRPQGFPAPALPAPAEPVCTPVVIEAPPLLTDTVAVSELRATAASPHAEAAPSRAASRPKVKQPKPPRPVVQTADVYALIEATLARTVTEVSSDPFPDREPVIDTPADAVAALPPPPAPAVEPPAAATPAGRWPAVWQRLGRLWHRPQPPRRDR